MLGAKSIDGTVMQKRITSLCAEAFGNANISSEELNQHTDMFTSDMMDFIKRELRDYLYFFNYVDHPLDSDPDTTFFKYNASREDKQAD